MDDTHDREELDSLTNEQGDHPASEDGEQEEDVSILADEEEQESEEEDIEARLRKLEEAYKAQKTRAEKAEKKLRALLKEDRQTQKDTDKPDPYEQLARRLVRTELRTLGVQTEEEFEFVERAAKLLGVDPVEALSDPVVSAKLEAMRKERQEKQSSPPSRSSAGSAQRKLDRIVADFEQHGIIPEDPKEFDMLQEYLTKRRG